MAPFSPGPAGGPFHTGRRGAPGGAGAEGGGGMGTERGGGTAPAGRAPGLGPQEPVVSVPPPGAQLPPDGSPDGGAPGGSRWRRWGEAGRVPGAERRHLRPPPGSPSPGQAQLRPQTEPGGPRVAAR